jgi:hypothetical protein
MELGITGHNTRGKEVIKILRMLDGKNRNKLIGADDNFFYYISNRNKTICMSYIDPEEIKGYEIFSLEDFLKKNPYRVGDKVNVWIKEDCFGGRGYLTDSEIISMRWNSDRCEIAYGLKNIDGEFYKIDIIGKVNDNPIKTIKDMEEKKINQMSLANCDLDEEENPFHTTNEYEEIVGNSFQGGYEKCKLDIQLNGYELPDGYHFTDENGNVIDATKILIKKNAPTYPKTYDECCDVLKIPNDERYTYIDVPLDYNKLLDAFTELLICRDAYWKIAGEQIGLGKPWKPDFSDDSPKYNIFKYENEITLSDNNWSNRILAFPTIEMRNAFYKNFKHLIEQCKELL